MSGSENTEIASLMAQIEELKVKNQELMGDASSPAAAVGANGVQVRGHFIDGKEVPSVTGKTFKVNMRHPFLLQGVCRSPQAALGLEPGYGKSDG
jgi:hypothetical protein